MNQNPLKRLKAFGQSVWLDDLRRSLITSGELSRFVEEDGLCGLTSNPSIFEKAMTGRKGNRVILESHGTQREESKAVYERMAVGDIQDASDILYPVYVASKRRDGYVSLEVSPLLAHDTEGTLEEARRLWKTVGRENLMIKVPATTEGIAAFSQLISEGININVTLLFALDTYLQVVDAYMTGLEKRKEVFGDLDHVASVASFFISRIDTAVDGIIAERLDGDIASEERTKLSFIHGKVAIASAKLAYQKYMNSFSGKRWDNLDLFGAQTQRLLWASTGTKNPDYHDVVYVEGLIGHDTVNTLPIVTLAAFRDHGCVRSSLVSNLDEAEAVMETVENLGISMAEIGDRLLAEGVRKFADSFANMLIAIDHGDHLKKDDPTTLLRVKLFRALYKGFIHS